MTALALEAPAYLAVDDISVAEGDEGTTSATFPMGAPARLLHAADQGVVEAKG